MHVQSAPCLSHRLLTYSFRDQFDTLFAFGPLDPNPCQHLFTINASRSHVPSSPHASPDSSTKWILSLTCQRCLGHLDVAMDFAETTVACPAENAPFHQFCYDHPHYLKGDDNYSRLYSFHCQNQRCCARLLARLRPARLDTQEVTYLLNAEERMAWVRNNSTQPYRDRNVLEALDVVCSYVQGCLDNLGRTISKDNPAFITAVGLEGQSFMHRLGFSLILDHKDDDKPVWKPPYVLPHDLEHGYMDKKRAELEDIREEIIALIQRRPDAEKRGRTRNEYAPPPTIAALNLTRMLGADDYLRITPPPQQRVEPLMGLGALPDFEDHLVNWCYDRCVQICPQNTTFYFRCLGDVAKDRQTETVMTKAMTLASQGLRSDLEINQAWESIGIAKEHNEVLNDNTILDHFRARYQDSGPDQQREMVEALDIIADYRGSAVLKNAISGAIENYEQALAFLGATEDTADEFILSLKTAKEQEGESLQERARTALQIIAKHRNSNLLLSAVQGDSQAAKMDLLQAYAILGADPKADDDTLIFAFPGLITDYPAQRSEIIQAMLSIAESRNSSDLRQQAEAARQGQQSSSSPRSVEDPRGLENIGNTCYLNSFLQYLYTVKPLRELVEIMDDHRQDLSHAALAMKKVGDERVTRAQVERAQSFVAELKGLFEELKTSRYNAVKLNRSLAALTVAPTGDWTASREQEKRRRSTLVSSKPPKVKANEAQINGPANPDTEVIDVTESPLEDKSTARIIDESNEDDQLTPPTPTPTKIPLDDKRIEDIQVSDAPQSPANDPMDTTAEPQIDLYDPRLSGDTIASATVESEPAATAMDVQGESVSAAPPPVPPRTGADATTQFSGATKEKIEEWAQQQDMREALANVFRQLRWAMKNEDLPMGQEQVDLISRLFYGKENIVTGNSSQEKAIESIPFHALYVIPDESYENIYSMLDGAYGFRDITDETSQQPRTQFSTFSHIPPILNIDVAVTTWDREAQHAVRRAPFKVAESLYMDRYLDQPELIEKRRQSSALNLTLSELKTKRAKLTQNEMNMDMPTVLRIVSTYLTELFGHEAELGLQKGCVQESLIQNLNEIAEMAQNEIRVIDNQISDVNNQMSALFPEEGDLLYRLHAVCVHSGRAESGHYYIYINANNTWYKYNDETVERVTDTGVVLNPTAGSTGVPAMLVYVRDSEMANLTQTVCREPVESMTQAVYQGASSPPRDWS